VGENVAAFRHMGQAHVNDCVRLDLLKIRAVQQNLAAGCGTDYHQRGEKQTCYFLFHSLFLLSLKKKRGGMIPHPRLVSFHKL
jgi:hypothetical protein